MTKELGKELQSKSIVSSFKYLAGNSFILFERLINILLEHRMIRRNHLSKIKKREEKKIEKDASIVSHQLLLIIHFERRKIVHIFKKSTRNNIFLIFVSDNERFKRMIPM